MELFFGDDARSYLRGQKHYKIHKEIFSTQFGDFPESGLFLRAKVPSGDVLISSVFYVDHATLEDLFDLDVFDHAGIVAFAKLNPVLFKHAAWKHCNAVEAVPDQHCFAMGRSMPFYDMSEMIRTIVV